jgi:hypothetical protein
MESSSLNSRNSKLVWILEDNLLVLSIIKNAIAKKDSNVRIVGYSSFFSAASDLLRLNSSDYPDKIIVDYDFGKEGNIEFFIRFVSLLDNHEKMDIILHSDTPEHQLVNVIGSPLVKKFIPKSTDFLPLFDAIELH